MNDFTVLEEGSVTSPAGFLAAGVAAGFKRSGAADMALLYSERDARFAGAFTRCVFKAAPVLLCQERCRNSETIRAVAVNSGIANACTGDQGLANARESCRIVGELLHVPSALT